MKKRVLLVMVAICLLFACLLQSGCWVLEDRKPLELTSISMDKTEANCKEADLEVEREVIDRESISEDYTGPVPISYLFATSPESEIETDNVNEAIAYLKSIKLVVIIECASEEEAKTALKDLLAYMASTSNEEGISEPIQQMLAEDLFISLIFNTQVVGNYFCIYTTSAHSLISD